MPTFIHSLTKLFLMMDFRKNELILHKNKKFSAMDDFFSHTSPLWEIRVANKGGTNPRIIQLFWNFHLLHGVFLG